MVKEDTKFKALGGALYIEKPSQATINESLGEAHRPITSINKVFSETHPAPPFDLLIGDGKGTIVHESTNLSQEGGNLKWMKKYGQDNEDLPEA